MLWVNSCPRCKQGALYLDEDDSRHCLQCGYVWHSPADPIAAIQLSELLAAYGPPNSLMRNASNRRN